MEVDQQNINQGDQQKNLNEDVDIKDEEVKFQHFQFYLTYTIKQLQNMHGLKHGDYQRYRNFCSKKIRRLREKLKFTQLKGKHGFQKKSVTIDEAKEVRFLYIPLTQAERCWSTALELKTEADLKENFKGSQKQKVIQKLKKGCLYARELLVLGQNLCDERTYLEVIAYYYWLRGYTEVQLSKNWVKAAAYLYVSKYALENIQNIGPYEQLSACKNMIGEIEDLLTVSIQNASRASNKKDLDITQNLDPYLEQPFQSIQELAEKLKDQNQQQKQQGSTFFNWRQSQYQIPNDKIQGLIFNQNQLQKQFDDQIQKKDTSRETQLIFEQLVKQFNNIIQQVDQLIQSGALVEEKDQKMIEQLQTALKGYIIDLSLSKNKISSREGQTVFAEYLQQQDSTIKDNQQAVKLSKGKKPQDIAKIYESMQASLKSLEQVAYKLPGARAEQVITQSQAQGICCQAFQEYFDGHFYYKQGKIEEASQSFKKARDLFKDSLGQSEDLYDLFTEDDIKDYYSKSQQYFQVSEKDQQTKAQKRKDIEKKQQLTSKVKKMTINETKSKKKPTKKQLQQQQKQQKQQQQQQQQSSIFGNFFGKKESVVEQPDSPESFKDVNEEQEYIKAENVKEEEKQQQEQKSNYFPSLFGWRTNK